MARKKMLKKALPFLFLSLMANSVCFATTVASATQTMEISLKDYHWSYAESAPDREYGWLNGTRLSYKNQDNDSKKYWQVTYENTNHDSHYDGATQSGQPLQTTTNNKITTTEIIYGVPVATDKYVYIGYAKRNWDRNIEGGYFAGIGNVATSLEKYSWSYIPVGYRSEFKVNDRWDGAIDASVRFMFNGDMNGSDNSGTDPFTVNLGNKIGFKLEVPYTYKMAASWSLVVRPWYEYSGIKESNSVLQTVHGIPDGYTVTEPSSMTHQYGFDIGVNYKF